MYGKTFSLWKLVTNNFPVFSLRNREDTGNWKRKQ